MGKALIIKGADFSANATRRIIFDDKINISAKINPQGAGYVVGVGRYDADSIATLTAYANDGYAFKAWADGVPTATRDVYVGQNDATYTANFGRSGNLQFDKNNALYYNLNGLIRVAAVSGYVSTNFLGSDTTGYKNILFKDDKLYIKAQSDSNTGNMTVFLTALDDNPSIGKAVIKTYTSTETKNGMVITANQDCEIYITNKTSLEANPIARFEN